MARTPEYLGGDEFNLPDDDELFQTVRATMFRGFGYFDDYPPYRIVYPWMLRRLRGLSSGARLLDLGAGINPLPLVLAEAGFVVDCVDSSNIVRTLPATADWNGWGFFNYVSLHPNLRSFQSSAEDFRVGHYDGIYCAGMLAHLKAAARTAVIANCASMLDVGAPLLLYLDLIPGTDFIWNRCADKEVEDRAIHGTQGMVLEEFAAEGFELLAADVVRGVEGTRTDILMIHCVSACSGNVQRLNVYS